ncbi:MAG: amidohydrolase family protein [Candidatus Methanomethylicaceae archaeon]
MIVDVVLKGGNLVTSEGIIQGGIAIDNGKIVSLAKDAVLPNASETIDCSGKYILPGVIDPHIHIGLHTTLEDDCHTETASAIAGGVTTAGRFVRSLRSYKEFFKDEIDVMNNHSYIDMFCHFAIMHFNHVREVSEYSRLFGVTSFKFYGKYGLELMSYVSEPPRDVIEQTDDGLLYSGFCEVAKIGQSGIACVHAENYEVIHWLKDELRRTGRQDLAAWTAARPWFCEAEYMIKAIFFARVTGVNLYNLHLSIGKGVEIIEKAMKDGVRVFAETCPHYLVLTKDSPIEPVKGKICPPLRETRDQELLWDGLARGIIKTIGSDHVIIPKKDDLWTSWPGVPGIGTLLPIILSEGVNKGRIPFSKVPEICSTNAAKIFGLYPRKGALQIGADADLVVADMNKEVVLRSENLYSKCGWTPYEGMHVKGYPVMTFLRGNKMMENGQIIGKIGSGKYIPRQAR